MVEVIHSGGQTGGDQGGLAAAVTLGLKTGGIVPKGYRTEAGNATWLKKLGLKEHESSYYWPRTKANVENTDGTLIFGNPNSKGCTLTRKYISQFDKPSIVIPWKSGDSIPDVDGFVDWVNLNKIKTLNVAGNRESSQPGIFQATHDFLVRALSEVNKEEEKEDG